MREGGKGAGHERGRKEERETLTASCQPAEVDIVIFNLLRVDEQKDLFCLLKVSCGCLCLSVVEVEHIIIEEGLNEYFLFLLRLN